MEYDTEPGNRAWLLLVLMPWLQLLSVVPLSPLQFSSPSWVPLSPLSPSAPFLSSPPPLFMLVSPPGHLVIVGRRVVVLLSVVVFISHSYLLALVYAQGQHVVLLISKGDGEGEGKWGKPCRPI
jgi:hypothetical protein